MSRNTKRDDNPILTKADTKRAIRFADLPESLQQQALKPARGPQKAPTKVGVHIRLWKPCETPAAAGRVVSMAPYAPG